MTEITEDQIKEEFLNEIEQIFDNTPDEDVQTKIENEVETEYIVTSTDNVDEIEYYLPEIGESVKTDHNDEIVMYIEYTGGCKNESRMNCYKIALFYKEDKNKEKIKNGLKKGKDLRIFGEAIVIDHLWNVYPETHPFIEKENHNRLIRTVKWFLNNYKGEFY